MASIPCRAALEGNDAPWPELNEDDDKDDHIGLRRQRVRGVQELDPLLEPTDHRRPRQRAPDIADAAHNDGHEALNDIVAAHLRGHLGKQPDGDTSDPRNA